MRRRRALYKRYRRKRISSGVILFIVILFVVGVFLTVALTGGKLPQRRLVRTTSRRTYRRPLVERISSKTTRPVSYPAPPPFTEPEVKEKRVSDDAEFQDALRNIREGMRLYQSAGLGAEEDQSLLRAAREKFLEAGRLLESVNRRFPNEQAVERTYQELMRYLHDTNKRLGVR